MLETVEQELRAFLSPLLDRQGLVLVGLRVWRKGRAVMILIFIDLPRGGISLDQCAAVNKAVAARLEEQPLFEEDYFLEVSSPGLDWPLTTEQDFQRVLERPIQVVWTDADGRDRQTAGVLTAVDGEWLTVSAAPAEQRVRIENIKKATQLI